MNDNEGRGLVLQRLYDLRDPPRWVEWKEFDDLGFPRETAGRFLEQLHDLGLIDWRAARSGQHHGYAQIVAKINGNGSDAIENSDDRPPQVVIDQSTHVTGSQHVQIGSGNTQTVTLVDKLNAANVAIDHSSATMEEKREAKSLLNRLSENKLLASVLALVFSHHSAS